MIAMKDWERYIARLKKISDKAAAEMQAYVDRFGFGNTTAIINHAYALATKYGEAAAAAACDMYDAVAAVSRVSVPAAVPAETATYGDVAKAINGAINQGAEGQVPQITGRYVKRAGADTTLKNAIRDGAEFAWVPHGDTCAFCITLASGGWRRASEKALKGGHAEHIHSNCDCEYAIRFGDDDGVRGYDPDRYKRIYYDHGGDINSIRREQYQKNKEKINAQKRAAYAKNKLIGFNKNGDPIYDVFGPASKSHPEEVERIKTSALAKGVELIESNERMAYSPGLKSGDPGQLIISEKDSIGAWLHEEQHMLDDEKDGFPGFKGLFDIGRRCKMEYNAYKREIELAKSAGREDIVKKLKQLCKKEIKAIGGVWDEKQLE